jgi:superfamily I DNA and RNA helicase
VALEVVYGEPRNRVLATELARSLREVASDGTVYLGYPVLATADDRVFVDALLVSESHGLAAFQIAEGVPVNADQWTDYVTEQDRLYSVLESHLGRHDALRQGRRLAVPIETVTVFPATVTPPGDVEGRYVSFDDVPSTVDTFEPLAPELCRALSAALQRVTTIKPTKRRDKVGRSDSRGAILKEIERGIANLDRWQKQAAIESPDGPQRIRGLAGSGKTIVLALKAAYLQAQHPEWRIGVCFFSRALYQQFADLITRFTFEHTNDKPDFEHLQLLHAWGGAGRDGMYRVIARKLDAPIRDFGYARATWGRDGAFRGACAELLQIASASPAEPIFDAVLIDEAQDLPAEFFQLVYRFVKNPKRIVWAYDELQNLSESAMPSTSELFGVDAEGDSVIRLDNKEGEARRDIVLPICYRNPPWSLATAHAIGFGIYRQGGLVQHFDDVELWDTIGYEAVSGTLRPGRRVDLRRSADSYPEFLPRLLDPVDSIQVKQFANQAEQDEWIANQIAINLSVDELDADDVIIVLPDPITAKKRASRIGAALARHEIETHLVGVNTSADEFWVRDSVAMAHIHRAKGNEGPMVYVVDSQYTEGKINAVTRRNTMFTAITRSRAWVRICGWGDDMSPLVDEIDAVRSRDFHLDFKLPTSSELANLRRVHRERTHQEAATIRRSVRSASELLDALVVGDVESDDLPEDVRAGLLERLRADAEVFDDE